MSAPTTARNSTCDACGLPPRGFDLSPFTMTPGADPVRTAAGAVARVCVWCHLDAQDFHLLGLGADPFATLANATRLRLLPAGDARDPDDERGNHPAE
jgi:hypothetical protein